MWRCGNTTGHPAMRALISTVGSARNSRTKDPKYEAHQRPESTWTEKSWTGRTVCLVLHGVEVLAETRRRDSPKSLMKRNCHCKSIHQRPEVIMSLDLSHYNFSTPEIRLLLRQVLGHAPSGRTIKRLARSAGHKLKRGRPLTTPNVHKGDLNDLVELTSNGLEACSGNSSIFS